MLDVIRYAVFIIFVISVCAAAWYSLNARRKADPAERGIAFAAMNIWMGVMLIALSVVAMLLFSGSTPAVIVEAVFMVLGAFNIFSGLRSRTYFTRRKSSQG